MQYTKQAIDFSDQLSLLKQRGLIIDDEDKALRCLHSISYFRLTSYLVPMESDSDTHAFRPNSHLHTAIALYNFDRKLRSLVFTSIQDIEVALRTRIIHYFSLAHGPFWFMRNDLFINESIHQTCINNIASEVSRPRKSLFRSIDVTIHHQSSLLLGRPWRWYRSEHYRSSSATSRM